MAHSQQFNSLLVGDTTSDVTDFITSILEASSEHCIFSIDLEGNILLWNEGASRTYGYEPREMLGQEKLDLLFPLQEQALKRSLEVINLTLRYGKWKGSLNQQRKNGLIFPARITITLRHDKKEKVVGLLIISNDISREIILEDLQFEELKIAHLYMRSLIEANADSLMVTDTNGIITDVNNQICKVVGQQRAEIIGSPFKTYFTNPQQAQEEIRIALTKGTVRNEDLILQSREGNLIAVSCNVTTFQGTQGQTLGVLITARDVTEYKAAEEKRTRMLEQEQMARAIQVEANEQLQHLNELQQNFIAIVSHEFRTTLTGILGFSELLQEQECSPEEVKDYASDINGDAQRLNRMINDVLDLGRVQSGKMVIHLEQVDINALIKEVVEHMRIATHRIIPLHQDASPLLIEGNPDKLIQVITNLLTNAIKYSPEGDDILVISQKEDHNAHICIQDQGIGIPEEALERIFVPFNRIDSEKTRYIQGTGLGLTIAREMIMMHGGHLWAESTLGKGSQFHFTLPLLEKNLAPRENEGMTTSN
jgi:PAS domain S-box-containing protein